MNEPSIELLVRVIPRLPGGPVHLLSLNGEAFEISTIVGVYGNRESTRLRRVPHITVSEVRSFRKWLRSRCLVRYADEYGQPRTIQLSPSIDYSTTSPQLTATLAWHLGELRAGRNQLYSFPPILIPIPPSNRLKLIYGLGLVALPVILRILPAGGNIRAFSAIATIFLVLGLVALAIDHIRLHSNWHPLVKIVVAVLVFGLSFVGTLTLFALLENIL